MKTVESMTKWEQMSDKSYHTFIFDNYFLMKLTTPNKLSVSLILGNFFNFFNFLSFLNQRSVKDELK